MSGKVYDEEETREETARRLIAVSINQRGERTQQLIKRLTHHARYLSRADRMAGALGRTDPVYAYEFNDRGAPAPEAMRTLPFPVGASHSLELRYLFDVGGAPPLNPAQQALSAAMIGYWSSFVHSGSPAAGGQPDWPAVDGAGPWMSLQPDGSRMVSGYQDEHQCPFWAGLKGR